eukprot:7385560-Prymnesium_polylepis.1
MVTLKKCEPPELVHGSICMVVTVGDCNNVEVEELSPTLSIRLCTCSPLAKSKSSRTTASGNAYRRTAAVWMMAAHQ